MKSRLFRFNIGNEVAIPYGEQKSYTPPRLIRQMREDLSLLPLYWAKRERQDAVLVNTTKGIDSRYINNLWGIPILTEYDILLRDHLYDLSLFAPEPTLERELRKRLGSQLFPLFRERIPFDKLLSFYDRSLGQLFLSRYYPALAPCVVNTIEELLDCPFSSDTLILKQPYSSSGRGIFSFSQEDLKKQTTLSKLSFPLLLEPFYNIESNWATEYEITEDGEVLYLGLSSFTTSRFRYVENLVAPQEFLLQKLSKQVNIQELKEIITKQIDFIQQEIAPYYRGYLGVDMFVYEGKLHPCCEFNVRMTMGHCALALASRFCTDALSSYRFSIQSIPIGRGWTLIEKEKKEECILLTPLNPNTQFVAILSDAYCSI